MPTRFGAYEILHELKVGGMGAVLLGRRRGPGSFEQLVAIKTIRPEYASAPAVRAMFLDEAAILARLSHPGIATVHDFGEEAGTLYMVMEYVAGIPFRELQDLHPPPTIAVRAIAEAARGLHGAHELRALDGSLLGVVHRDISPDNLMLGYDGHVKVIDFGIALVKNRQSPVTEFGTVKGKPPYMSPEQVKNESLDRRSDVFSLAVVLHELLVDASLFVGDSIYAVARAVEHHPIPPPSRALGVELPLGLDAAVMTALDRDPARRTPSAAAFATSLEDVIQVAGGESLQAWAEHALAGHRDAHRAWLAGIVGGVDAPRPMGRPTGAVTAVGPDLGRPPAASPPPSRLAPELAETHLAADTTTGAPPRRSSRMPLVLAALVLGALGIGIFAVSRDGAPARDAGVVATLDATPPDAAVAPGDAPEDPVPAPRDAAIVDAAPPDARRSSPPDASGRSVPRDAAPVPLATPDAAPVRTVDAAPEGVGFLNVYHRANGHYVNAMLDGRSVGPTPINRRRLAAGPHTIQLLAADTSAVVFEQTVTIDDGKVTTVRQP